MSSIIRVFDIETTGTDVNPFDHTVVAAGNFLCNPGRSIPPEAEEDLRNAPLFGQIWPQLATAGVTVFAAHNSEFEASFLPTPAGVDWICTFKAALHAWPDAPGHSNQVLRYWRGLDERPAFSRETAALSHRAAPDAYVTAHLLLDLLQVASVAQLIKCTMQPKRYSKLTFGKHRGTQWGEVPFDYLQWLSDGKHDMDADWRACARRELDRRQRKTT